ncbi:MAG: DUF3622 domain-containing protein [Gammaproteobacteria bacterium]|nr:DUF3622 domain-containing protein [Gammaproteobacteria bacterium]
MKQSKKYDFLIEKEDDNWTAVIIRRVTSRTTVVSKTQSGFASEAEAQAWAQDEVKAFLKKANLGEQEKRRAKKVEDDKKSAIKMKSIKVQEEDAQKEEQEENSDN